MDAFNAEDWPKLPADAIIVFKACTKTTLSEWSG
jgi:hypothetical protein